MEHEVQNAQTLYEGRVFDVHKVSVRLPDGRDGIYDLVVHAGAVTVVPVDELGNIWFVRQYRVGAGKALLELPAGVLDDGEDPQAAAGRELQEEIGMAAGRLEALGEFYLAPGYSTEHMYVYLARDLSASRLTADDDEFITVESVPIAEAYEMAQDGLIQDAKSLAALFLARVKLGI